MAAGRTRLVAAGISAEEAAIDVELFARTILEWDRARIITSQSSAVPEGLEPTFDSWLVRRARHEPSAYIVGTKEFWGLDFIVTPAVLVPRPETELIVEEALRLFADRGASRAVQSLRFGDIGTGSGNIAVSLAHELPHCRVVATDVSSDALSVATRNAQRHGVADRIEFVAVPYLEGVTGEFDAIAANPPYVRELDRNGLGAEIAYEPEVALFGGVDGLRDIEGVLHSATRQLRSGGWLLMEMGAGMDDRVEELVHRKPDLRLVDVRRDLQGIPRTAVIHRN
jgi:release factor glutamine methyltransferase